MTALDTWARGRGPSRVTIVEGQRLSASVAGPPRRGLITPGPRGPRPPLRPALSLDDKLRRWVWAGTEAGRGND